MDPSFKAEVRHMIARYGRPQSEADLVINWFASHDGNPREQVLKEAVEDGFLCICGFDEEGPIYHMPDAEGGPHWLQMLE